MRFIFPPIFLVGAERSGTTLLRLMLDHHPQIAWSEEFEYSVDMVPEQGGWPDLKEYREWLDVHRIFRSSRLTIDPNLDYPDLIRSFLQQKRHASGKPYIGATVHRHFDRLLRIWPDARFIHLVRDGRDVAQSCVGMGWAGNVWTGIERWIESERLWDEVAAQTPQDRWIGLTYENLVSSTEETLRDLCDFIGVDYDPSMMGYTSSTAYKAPDSSLMEQWRKRSSELDIQLVEARAGSLLVRRGYELSGLPPRGVTPAMEKRLRAQDRWSRLRFRFRRLGPRLYLSDLLSRRLGLGGWQKKIRLEINAKDNAYLK